MAQGVGDQVGQDLTDPDRIDVDQRQVALDGGRQLHAGRGRRRLEGPNDVDDQELGIGRLAVEGERARLGQGHRAQVVDQPGENARLVEDDGEVRRVGRIDAIDDRLEVPLDDGQRRPELVADLGQQGPSLALVGLEPGGHRVEADDQLADRAEAARLGPDPDVVPALLDRAGGLHEFVERRRGRSKRAPERDQDRRRRPPGR